MKSCPFCNSKESIVQPCDNELMPDRNTEAKYKVVCAVCFADGPPATTGEMAVKKWDGLLANIRDNIKFKEALTEDMGGVSTPMSTLSNTPGVGTAQPASSAAMTGAQQTSDTAIGSGDKWDNDAEDDKSKKKKKIAVQRAYESEDDIQDKYHHLIKADEEAKKHAEDIRQGRLRQEQQDEELRQWGKDQRSKANEGNLNPYDQIGAMMAKKMGVKQPFKKVDSKTNTVKQNIIDEVSSNTNPFTIETLDTYVKASKLVPKHPLQKKKINEENSLSDEENLKDSNSKLTLKHAGIPFIYKDGPSGKKRVYINSDVNDAVEKLEELDWEAQEVLNNPKKTVKIFHKDGKELTIYTDGKDLPRVTLTDIMESVNPIKIVSNSLEPYIKYK